MNQEAPILIDIGAARNVFAFADADRRIAWVALLVLTLTRLL